MNLVSIYISLKNGSLYLTLSYLHFILLITDPMTHCHSLTIKQEMAHIAERIYCSGYYHWRTVTQKTQLDHDRHLITWFTIGNTTLTTQVIPERQSTSSVISANLKPIKLLLVVVNQAIANPLFIYLTGWEDLMWWLTCVRGDIHLYDREEDGVMHVKCEYEHPLHAQVGVRDSISSVSQSPCIYVFLFHGYVSSTSF